jgi:protein arginine kinase activator
MTPTKASSYYLQPTTYNLIEAQLPPYNPHSHCYNTPMDCQCCNKKPARVRVCDLEDNAIAEQYNVCPDCFALIKRYMFDLASPLMPTEQVIREVQTLLGAGAGALSVPEQSGALAAVSTPEPVPACPDCGMTLSEFKARGRFGCPRDYEIFAEHLDPLFERIHDVHPARHEGRVPNQPAGALELVERRRRLSTLKTKLEHAVADENYELAAALRDEISGLEGAAAEGNPG